MSFKTPGVLERAPAAFDPIGAAVMVFELKRGVEVDRIDRGTVHAPHDVEVVSDPYGLIRPVGPPSGRGPFPPSFGLPRDAIGVPPCGWPRRSNLVRGTLRTEAVAARPAPCLEP